MNRVANTYFLVIKTFCDSNIYLIPERIPRNKFICIPTRKIHQWRVLYAIFQLQRSVKVISYNENARNAAES